MFQTNAITPSAWFVHLYVFKWPGRERIPSKPGLLFPSDSGVLVSLKKFLTYTITKSFPQVLRTTIVQS